MDDLLLAYGISKTSITRLKSGDFNLSKVDDEILYKKKIFFKQLDLSQNGKILIYGLEQFSDQLTHFYAYKTSLTNIDLSKFRFQNLIFFGGLENINKETLPKNYTEYQCSACTGSLKSVPNQW